MTYTLGVEDYHGHYSIHELCDTCPANQLKRCADRWKRRELPRVTAMAEHLGRHLIEVASRAIAVSGRNERPRYFMQHILGDKIDDVAKPHHSHQHGRADIGWQHVQEAA